MGTYFDNKNPNQSGASQNEDDVTAVKNSQTASQSGTSVNAVNGNQSNTTNKIAVENKPNNAQNSNITSENQNKQTNSTPVKKSQPQPQQTQQNYSQPQQTADTQSFSATNSKAMVQAPSTQTATQPQQNQSVTDTVLPQDVQQKIQQYKQQYAQAAAKGDMASAQAARTAAERLRNQNGYYSSVDGSALYRIDQNYVDRQIEFAKAAYDEAAARKDIQGMQEAHATAEYYRSLLGYTGGTDGSGSYRLNPDGTVNYDGMSYSEMWKAAKAVGDKYTMAYAANEADKARRSTGFYGGDDGTAGIPITATEAKISQLKESLTQAYASGDTKQASVIQQEIANLYKSIGQIQCDDGTVRTITELNYYIEQQKRAYDYAISNNDQTSAKTAHDNAVWASKQLGYARNDDGTTTPLNATIRTAMNSGNEPMNVSVDQNGNIIGIYNPDGSINSDYRGLVTLPYGGSSLQWIAYTSNDGRQSFVKVDNSAKSAFYEVNPNGSMNEKTAISANGNTLTTDNLVYGVDGNAYDRATGRTLAELASEYGLTAQNFVQKVTLGNGQVKYYNLNGVDVTYMYSPVQNGTMGDYGNDTLDSANKLLAEVGFNNVPQIENYNKLSWAEALKMAEEQVNGQYNEKLDYNLNRLNTNALQTGFYGQLPTEALKQQAVASTEVDRQKAVYDLATQLMQSSQDEAQRMYEDDMQTTQQRIETITTIFNQVYQAVRDAITDKQTDKQLQVQDDMNKVTSEGNKMNYNINLSNIWTEVINAYVDAHKSGLGVPGVISNAVSTAYNRLINNWQSNM